MSVMESVIAWLSKSEPRDLPRMVLDVNTIINNKATSCEIERALKAAYRIGRQSLICVVCGDYVPPNDAYCDCRRDMGID